MFNIRFIFVLVSLCVLISAGHSIADTEISGAVSGEWTSEGSPYIVVDSTWVPEGERLAITGHLDVLFEENQGLYVFGELNTFCEEGGHGNRDSVFIRVSEGVEHWRGIRVYSGGRFEMHRTFITCPDTALFLDANCEFLMDYSAFDYGCLAMKGLTGPYFEGCEITFTHSYVPSLANLLTLGGRIVAESSEFHFNLGDPSSTPRPGFWGEGTSFRFSHCVVRGSLQVSFGCASSVENSRFYWRNGNFRVGVGICGANCYLRDSYVDGGVGVTGSGGSTAEITNNTITGGLGGGGGNINVSRCSVGDLSDFGGFIGCDNVTLKNSVFGRNVSFTNTRSVNIDSCYFVYETLNRLGGNKIYYRPEEFPGRISITHSLLRNDQFYFPDVNSIIMDHNTVVIDSGAYDTFLTYNFESLVLTNNIFLSRIDAGELFFIDEMPIFRYNCFWGFDDFAWLALDGGEIIHGPDSTNLLEDPLLEIDGLSWLLSPNSPCIDRGDPNAPLDPDGTRTDIGFRAFYQRIGDCNPYFDQTLSTPIIVEAYPNPFNNTLNVSIKASDHFPVHVDLYDVSGRIILQQPATTYSTGLGSLRLDASSLPTGQYFLKVRSNQFTEIKPVNCLK